MRINSINPINFGFRTLDVNQNQKQPKTVTFGMAKIDMVEIKREMQFLKEFVQKNGKEFSLSPTTEVKKILQEAKQEAFRSLPLVSFDSKAVSFINETFKGQKDILAKIYLTPDEVGNLFVHKADVSKIKLMNEALKDQPEVLAKIYTTPDENKNIFVHYADANQLKLMNEALKDQPKVLAEIYSTPDKYGRFFVHMADESKLKLMNEALKDQHEALTKIYLSLNTKGHLFGQGVNEGQLKLMNEALAKRPEVLAKLYMAISWMQTERWPEPLQKTIMTTVKDLATNSELDERMSLDLLNEYTRHLDDELKLVKKYLTDKLSKRIA